MTRKTLRFMNVNSEEVLSREEMNVETPEGYFSGFWWFWIELPGSL